MDDDAVEPEEFQIQEAEFWKRMGKCQNKSIRLERAKASPKATKFFKRPPDASQGFDRLWVSAIDYVCFKSMVGMFRNYGIEFADNFGDFIDGCPEDGLYSIEDMASYKARKVYEATGLPCIASRTSFEIEPIPPDAVANVPGKAAASAGISNPKVLSGYKINDIGMHADYLCDALRPMSEPDRVTRFTSCICFYDGEIEILEHGICEVDLHFADSRRTHIPMSHAINNMAETLKYTFVSSLFLFDETNHHTCSHAFSMTKQRDWSIKKFCDNVWRMHLVALLVRRASNYEIESLKMVKCCQIASLMFPSSWILKWMSI